MGPRPLWIAKAGPAAMLALLCLAALIALVACGGEQAAPPRSGYRGSSSTHGHANATSNAGTDRQSHGNPNANGHHGGRSNQHPGPPAVTHAHSYLHPDVNTDSATHS